MSNSAWKLIKSLNSPKAKAQLTADMAKGQTKAKTAKTPLSKQKIADKINEAKKTKARLSSPGELARCRYQRTWSPRHNS